MNLHMTGDHLFLTDAELENMGIAPREIADAIERALVARAEGRLHVAPKSAILPGGGRYMMSTLAVGDEGLTVLKSVAVCPENPGRGLPAINGAIMVLDAETGQLRAVMGANWITAHRTAALSAVAARRLADPASETVAFIGCGVQAQSHLIAFADQFPLKRVRAFGRGQANLEAFCTIAREIGLEVEAPKTPEETLNGADIVVSSVTLNYDVKPFLDANWLKPNAFAAITDLCIPWHDESLGRFGTIVVDDMDQETSAERPMLPRDRITGDLTDLVMGRIPAPAADRPRAFAFRGIALGDYAAAVLALERARETGTGQIVAPPE